MDESKSRSDGEVEFAALVAIEVEGFLRGKGSGKITGTMDRRRWDAILAALRTFRSERGQCPFCKKPDPNFKYDPQGEWQHPPAERNLP